MNSPEFSIKRDRHATTDLESPTTQRPGVAEAVLAALERQSMGENDDGSEPDCQRTPPRHVLSRSPKRFSDPHSSPSGSFHLPVLERPGYRIGNPRHRLSQPQPVSHFSPDSSASSPWTTRFVDDNSSQEGPKSQRSSLGHAGDGRSNRTIDRFSNSDSASPSDQGQRSQSARGGSEWPPSQEDSPAPREPSDQERSAVLREIYRCVPCSPSAMNLAGPQRSFYVPGSDDDD